MKRITLTKHLNRVELGKGNTHEGYFYINSELKDTIDLLMPENEQTVEFKSLDGGDSLLTRLTKGREYRLPGLGDFFRTININSEDEIKLVFQEKSDGGYEYFYRVIKHDNAICLKWLTTHNGFDMLTNDRDSLLDRARYKGKSISLDLKGYFSKREDSPGATPIYDLMIDGKAFDGKGRPNIILFIEDGNVIIMEYESWVLSTSDIVGGEK